MPELVFATAAYASDGAARIAEAAQNPARRFGKAKPRRSEAAGP
jgi:hypothetical protein